MATIADILAAKLGQQCKGEATIADLAGLHRKLIMKENTNATVSK